MSALPDHRIVGQPPPSDYQLMLPDGWFRIPLQPEQRERSVEALVTRQFGGFDDAPHLRRLFREELLRRTADAYDEGGIELYISLQRAGGLTIPASLLITLVPPAQGAAMPSLHDLAESLRAENSEGRTVSIVEFDAGTALKMRVDPEAPTTASAAPPKDGTADDYDLPSVTVDYQLCVPRSATHLLLTFSTPLIQIADAMVELFDAVAESLSWKGE